MPDHLPGRSKDEGAGKPLTRAEFVKRERARKALELWTEGKSYTQVKNAMKLRNVDEARKQVEAGEAIWQEEESLAITRYRALMRNDMMEMRSLLMESVREGNLGNVDKVEKVWGRMARLLDLDAGKEEMGGPQIVVVNTSNPHLMGDVVDSTAIDDKKAPKGLPD